MSNKEIKVIHVVAKTADRFSAEFTDSDGKKFGDYDGYVPAFFPEKHWGDYLMLDIDLETGMILNWVKPTQQQVLEAINGEDE